MAYKCKILVAVTQYFMGISICIDTHLCTVSTVIGINKEKQIHLLNNEYKGDHR